ncbi:hypothetical protein [Romboutsia sp.]|uniref:hypothetical protein n=1 Tax=Romboutsia sp. TaxID=1965302 RepID=UPI003F30F153
MDKKFIKVCLSICLPLILLIGTMTMSVRKEDSLDYEDAQDSNYDFDIKYKSYTQDEYNHIITVLAQNKSKNIAYINNLELKFRYIGKSDQESRGRENFYIRGYEKGDYEEYSDERIIGIDPGKELEYTFRIPKAITIDPDSFDLKNPDISYNVNFYKFRQGKNKLMFGIGGSGGDKSLTERY